MSCQGPERLGSVSLQLGAAPNLEAHTLEVSDSLTLYSGDIITIQADVNKYWRNYDSIDGHEAIALGSNVDSQSKFIVEVVAKDQVRLSLANDGSRYLKRLDGWNGYEIIGTNGSRGESESVFTVYKDNLPGDQVRLGSLPHHRWKRFNGYDDGTEIVVDNDYGLPEANLTIRRIGVVGNVSVVDINYDIDNAVLGKTELVSSTKVTNDNRQGTTVQTHPYTVSKTVQTTKEFNWSNSFSIGVSTSFTTGVPGIFDATVGYEAAAEFTKGGSESEANTKHEEATINLSAPPGKIVSAWGVVTTQPINVKYTAKVRRVLPGNQVVEYPVSGVFNGISASEFLIRHRESD